MLREEQRVIRTTDGRRGQIKGLRAQDGCARVEFEDGTRRVVDLSHLEAASIFDGTEGILEKPTGATPPPHVASPLFAELPLSEIPGSP